VGGAVAEGPQRCGFSGRAAKGRATHQGKRKNREKERQKKIKGERDILKMFQEELKGGNGKRRNGKIKNSRSEGKPRHSQGKIFQRSKPWGQEGSYRRGYGTQAATLSSGRLGGVEQEREEIEDTHSLLECVAVYWH